MIAALFILLALAAFASVAAGMLLIPTPAPPVPPVYAGAERRSTVYVRSAKVARPRDCYDHRDDLEMAS